ncbi:lytic transglycosylase, partial [Nocardia abscessus]|nr:lytic transglycosylase [Nocardia abscessus]
MHSPVDAGAPQAPEVLAAASPGAGAGGGESRVAGLLPVTPELPRRLRAVSPPMAGVVPLQELTL